MVFRRIGNLFCFTLILIMPACSSEIMEDAMLEVESTDLSKESIDDITIGMSINDESLNMKHGKFKNTQIMNNMPHKGEVILFRLNYLLV